MARIRTIKPEFFRSWELYQRELAANKLRKGPYLNLRVAFAGLFTSADREGRFLWRAYELKLDCLPYDQVDFEEVLTWLAAEPNPFILRYEGGGKAVGCIPGFTTHQRPKFDEAASKLPSPPIMGGAPSDNRTPTVGQLSDNRRKEGKGKERKGTELGEGNSALASAVEAGPSPFHVFMDWALTETLGLEPGNSDPAKRKAVSTAYGRFGRAGRDILAYAEGDVDVAKEGTIALSQWLAKADRVWNLETIAKWFADWKVNPGAFNGKSR